MKNKRINWWDVWFCTLTVLVVGALTFVALLFAMTDSIL